MTEKDLDIAIEKCERIMEFDTRTLENPESENGHIFEKIYDLLQFLRQFQFATDTNVTTTDTISRSAAVEVMRKAKDKSELHRMLVQLPSAQPDYDEWCTDCKEYDQERHSCPRWNRVIRQTVEDVKAAQPGWIPTSERLPERYDNYLITTKDEDTDIGTFHPEFKQWSICDADGFRLTDGVLAWCELPKPWGGDTDAH